MKNISKVAFISVVLSIVIFTSSLWAENYTKQILFISSYSPTFYSFTEQVEGFKQGIEGDYTLHLEYMDAGNFWSQENYEKFYLLLKSKIDKYKHFDVIVVSDDMAIDFMQRHKDELFEDIPIVFFGAEDKELAEAMASEDKVYGMLEGISIEQNIELISKLHEGKNIVAITYNEAEGNEDLEEFYRISEKYKDINFKHISLELNGAESFREELSKLNEDDVILEFYSQSIGIANYDNASELNAFINKEIDLPKYNTIMLGDHGNYIGGKMTNQLNKVITASEITNDILNGLEHETKLYHYDDLNEYVFNYENLAKHGINEEDLPQDSVILNKPTSFFEENKEVLQIASVVVILLLLIIVVLIIHIVNRHKYHKKMLEANEALEKANKLQNDFVSNISHELRTPVAVILSSLQLIDIKSKNNTLSDVYTINTNIIKQNCHRLLRMINNIIDVSISDEGFTKLQLENVEIVSFIENICDSVIPYAKSKNIKLIFDTEQEELLMYVDPLKIEKVILNLLSNAIKYTQEYGNINVNVSQLDKNLSISVADNGVGIDKDNLDIIFNRFIQVDDTMTRSNEGSGIGLCLVKSFVNLHNGKINVASRLGIGSTFTVIIPIIEGGYDEGTIFRYESAYTLNTAIELSDLN